MENDAKIFVAGHRGLVGSALLRALAAAGYGNVVTRTRQQLDLTNQAATLEFFSSERPQYVFMAAAKVGGIHANSTYPAEFIYENLAMQANVIHSAYQYGVQRLLFLGSSCIYPRNAPQPMMESHLLTGILEPTNRPYAIAKIAGIEQCWSYNRQYGTRYLAVMPTNLFGPGDNYHPQNSHVIPALIRRFHEAKQQQTESVMVWGTGTPRREFMYVDDMADACLHLMNLPDSSFEALLAADRFEGTPPIVNVGVGKDISIGELAHKVAATVGYQGRIVFDPSKPDGAPRKLLDTSRLSGLGWQARFGLDEGLRLTYSDFLGSRATRTGER
jgi:GDP-L-fucose synthase